MSSPSTMLANLKSALARRDRDGVNRACRALINAQPAIGSQWRAIAHVLIENGELSAARRAIDLLVRAAGNSPLSRFVQAEIYARSGKLAEARAILADLPDDVPDPLSSAYTRGTTAINVGNMAEARTHLRRALAVSPLSGQSWLALATLSRMSDDDGRWMASLRDRMSAAPLVERGAYLYALGKFEAERGDADAAFASYAEGAAIEAALRTPAAGAAPVLAAADWSQEQLASLPRPARTSERPIFVTGLPRSGTTLIEQILTAHSQVDGGEELGLVRHLIGDAGGSADFASLKRMLDAGRGDALVGLYDHLVAERFPGSGRVVDKTLLASHYMGWIATLFPDAPVVWLRRDPLDAAWSIFRTYFRSELDWTFDLVKIAEQMAIEDRLFAHWTSLRPQQILPVYYAELTADPDAVIPRIVAHCGLALEPQQLRPHESERTVVTASVAQVRRPINQDAIGSAAPYRRHLEPFIRAYRDAGGTIE